MHIKTTLLIGGIASMAIARLTFGQCPSLCFNANTTLGSGAGGNLLAGADRNTAIGFLALGTSTDDDDNTAIGSHALGSNKGGHANTATGVNALLSNTTGISNTANGVAALRANIDGDDNTAVGISALESNTGGGFNTAIGASALTSNTGGNSNTAAGLNALFFNKTGSNNSAYGVNALLNNTASNNSASGFFALQNNGGGHDNTAHGFQALKGNMSGNNNVAVGSNAGANLTTGSNNIVIGANVPGVAGESGKIRIGKQGTQNGTFIAGISGVAVTGTQVVVNANGKLGVTASSARFKDDIKPMDKSSEAILGLKPITFHYKKEIDPEGIPQFGLIAEQVEKVNRDLVARDNEGKIHTVRYEAVNAMLLNEFLKEHHKVQEQEAAIAQLKSAAAKQEATATQQQNEIKALAATVNEQVSQIHRVSAQLELQKVPAETVANNQ